MSKHVGDLTGKVFNSWTVIDYAGYRTAPSGQIKQYWNCKCICGKLKKVQQHGLISLRSKSCGCSRRGEFGHSSRRNIFSHYRSRCKRKQLEFSITEELFIELVEQNCYYCGNPPSNFKNAPTHYGTYKYNGIDRIDNKEGYTEKNVVPCCKNCNLAKRQLTQIDFFDMIKRIYEKHKL